MPHGPVSRAIGLHSGGGIVGRGIGGALTSWPRRILWSSALFAVGQSILVLLGSRTRASGTFVTRDGIAFLAPDSSTYLEMAAAPGSIVAAPWTRWAYPALLSGLDATPLGFDALVLFQSAAFVVAGTLLHALAEDATRSRRAGIAASAALLVNPLTAQWVRFILTESLFLSLVVVAVWSTARLLRDWSLPVAMAAMPAALIAGTIRPNGVIILGATIAGIVAARNASVPAKRRRIRIAAVWMATAVLLGLAASVTGQPGEASIASQLSNGVVIEGTEDVRVTIEMPNASDPSDESALAAVRFGLEHPFATGRLAVARVVAEVVQIRPHYPPSINVAIGAAMLIFLVLLGLGLVDARSAALRAAGLSIAVPILLLIGLTFAVPEGRYGWGALVALMPIVGVGAERMLAPLARSVNADRRTR